MIRRILPGVLACFAFGCESGPRKFKLFLPESGIAVGNVATIMVHSRRKGLVPGPAIQQSVPVEGLRCKVAPPDVFQIVTCAGVIEVHALKEGSGILEAEGRVGWRASRVSMELRALRAAKTEFDVQPPINPNHATVRATLLSEGGEPLGGKDSLEIVEGKATVATDGSSPYFYVDATAKGNVRLRSKLTGSELTLSFPRNEP